MLVVHVHVRVRPGQVEEFLAATLTNARASTRFSAVFPPDGEGWASSAP
jgi:hypothetical protein